ncbi:MAG TPA: Uma2 family endonuclease [Nannocystaceae bacterium]|nr:Uma2 family endonuclease [Nannocystaceae bacterium]
MTAQQTAHGVDRTEYPETEPLGEDLLQRWIVELLRPLVERWIGDPEHVLVGADTFIYYEQFDAKQRYAPDVYVMRGVPQDIAMGAWKTWEGHPAPAFALEVVAQRNWMKDYERVPRRCAAIGVGELVVFDPYFARRRKRPGARWQVFRRTPDGFTATLRSNEPQVWSDALGCWLVATGEGQKTRLRLAAGDAAVIVPTPEEAERAAKEAERAAKEAERTAKEAERAAKEAALARIAELEAELARRDRVKE